VEPGEPGHQVELGRVGIAVHDGEHPQPDPTAQHHLGGLEPLVHRIVLGEHQSDMAAGQSPGGDRPREDLGRGHPGLHHEAATRCEVTGGVDEAGHLGVLVRDGVDGDLDGQDDHVEEAVDDGGAEVPDGRGDQVAAGAGVQFGDHGVGPVDPVDPEPPEGQRDGESPGAHAELEDGATGGELPEAVHGALGVVHTAVDGVVLGCDVAAVLGRVVLGGHGATAVPPDGGPQTD
jgi:hypothetical protein